MNEDFLFDAFADIDDEYIQTKAIPCKNTRFLPLKIGLAAAILAVLLLPLGLSSRSKPELELPCDDPYTIQEIDGKYYLLFPNLPEHPTQTPSRPEVDTENNQMEIEAYVQFDSIQELRHCFLTGEIDEDERICLDWIYSRYNYNPVIPNISNLYYPTLPLGLSATSVRWDGGEGYAYMLESKHNSVKGAVEIITEEEYNYRYSISFDPTSEIYNRSNVVKEKTIIRNATVYYHGDTYKEIVYTTINIFGNKMYVKETYDEIDDKVPSSIYMLGSNRGEYFRVSIRGLSIRPSILWLISFALIPVY